MPIGIAKNPPTPQLLRRKKIYGIAQGGKRRHLVGEQSRVTRRQMHCIGKDVVLPRMCCALDHRETPFHPLRDEHANLDGECKVMCVLI